MADNVSTPRVSLQYLDAFTGRTVIITGKVTQTRGETAVVDCGGEITVLLNRVRPSSPEHTSSYHPSMQENRHANPALCKQESHLKPGNAIEIVGKVNQDLTVKVLKATDMGPNLGA